MFKYLRNTLLNNKLFFSINIIITILMSLVQVSIPLFMKYHIDTIEKGSINLLFQNILLFIALLLLHNLFSVLWHYLSTKLGAKKLFDLRASLMKQLDSIPFEQIVHIGSEKIKHILFNDTLAVFRSAITFTIKLFTNVIIILLIFTILFFVNFYLFLILFTAFLIGFSISNFSRKYIRKFSFLVNLEFKKTNAFTNIFVDSIKTMKKNDLFHYYCNKHKKLCEDFLIQALKTDKVKAFLTNLISNINSIFSIIIITFLLITNNNYSLGNIILTLFYTDMIFKFSQEIEQIITSIGETLPSFEHIESIFQLKEEQSGTKSLQKINSITFHNVHFRYLNGNKDILNNLNCSFKQGDIIKVEGLNASGKSTFINIIKGVLVPTKGEYYINKKSISNFNKSELRRKILYIGSDELFLDEDIITYFENITKQNNINLKLKIC